MNKIINKIKNIEILEDSYKELSCDMLSLWFKKRSQQKSININIKENNNILNIEYNNTITTFLFIEKEKDIIDNNAYFFITSNNIQYINDTIVIPKYIQKLILNHKIPFIIEPLNESIYVPLNNNGDIISNINDTVSDLIEIQLEDISFSLSNGIIFDGFHSYYNDFCNNVDNLQKELDKEKEKENSFIKNIIDNLDEKQKEIITINRSLKKDDYYGISNLIKPEEENDYFDNGLINYRAVAGKIEKIDNEELYLSIINKISNYNIDDRSVAYWKLYLLERFINYYDDITLQLVFSKIKYAAYNMPFTVSPSILSIHQFLDELADNNILSKENDFEYKIINKIDNIKKYWLDNCIPNWILQDS